MNANEQIREAIGKILWCCQWMYDHTSDESVKSHLVEPIQLAKAALALPRRNCDVGTAEEQGNRMRRFCAKQKRNGIINCGYCQIKHQYERDCTLDWAQMPYKAQEGDGK